MEKTLIILKPDCMQSNLAGKVLDRLLSEGFSLKACKMMQLTEPLLRNHYAHLADKPFFPEIQNFMSSCPVIVAVFAGDNIISRVRDLLGPTDSTKAEKGTIRGDYGTDKMLNIAHASDGPEAAKAEIARFFRPEELFE